MTNELESYNDLVSKTKDLITKKDTIEAQIKDHTSVLQSHNIGMDEPLVDSQGFPRADIDVYAVRTARSEIAKLRTDHKSVMARIETALYAVHAKARTDNIVDPVASQRAVVHKPFAKIDSVAPNSPSASAGLKVDDLVTSFGSVVESTPDTLKAIASLVQRSKDKPISVVIIRQGTTTSLSVTPAEWNGRGLLGCHIVPLN